MKKQMKKIINFRLMLLLAVGMVVSIILTAKFFVSQKLKLWLIVGFAVIFLIFLTCFALFKKKFLLIVAIAILSITIPIFSMYIKVNKYKQNTFENVEYYNISAKIYNYTLNLKENKIYLSLENVKISDGLKVKNLLGNMFMCVSSNNIDVSKIQNGRYIKAKAEKDYITFYNGTEGNRKSLSSLSRKISSSCYVYSANFSFDDNVSLLFRDKVKNKVYALYEKTDLFFTGIGYAMLFGDSTILDEDVKAVFSESGTAHLLAVSGFHVSIIVAFLAFIFDKLRINKYIKLTFMSIILVFYAYICAFSVSIIRASVMAVVAIYAANRNKEYDGLSALSLAAVIILLINPLDLFNLSFIFSFVSVLSIILLMPVFNRALSKIFYSKLSSALSLNFAITIGVTIFQLYYFGKMPILCFLSNFVTVPIVSILFVYLIISCLVGLVINPIAVPLINGFGIVMKYVLNFNYWITGLGFYITVSNVSVWTLYLSLIFMFVLSDYVFLKKEIKWIICLLLSVIILKLIFI